jgi:hypothetical protein
LTRKRSSMAASSFRLPVLARQLGFVFAASLMLTACYVVLTAGPVRADCEVLDPTCVGETVDDTVDDAAETVDDTVDETTGDAEETVEETSEAVEETVESVTGDTGETIDETVTPGGGPVDDVIGGPSPPTLPGTDPVPPGIEDPAPTGGDGPGAGSDGDGPRGDGPVGTPPGGISGPSALDSSSLGSALVVKATPVRRGFLGGLAGPVAEAASRIAFPLALAVLVLLFVAFQNRVDRRDPKLALAATSPDVLRFG